MAIKVSAKNLYVKDSEGQKIPVPAFGAVLSDADKATLNYVRSKYELIADLQLESEVSSVNIASREEPLNIRDAYMMIKAPVVSASRNVNVNFYNKQKLIQTVGVTSYAVSAGESWSFIRLGKNNGLWEGAGTASGSANTTQMNWTSMRSVYFGTSQDIDTISHINLSSGNPFPAGLVIKLYGIKA